jgi:hypothetical protein
VWVRGPDVPRDSVWRHALEVVEAPGALQ